MNRDTAKQWFQTGDKPTQAQFEQLLDWLRFGDEGITIADVADLVNQLQAKASAAALVAFEQGERIAYNGNGIYVLPAGYLLDELLIILPAPVAIKIGTTALGDEIQPEIEMAAGGEVVTVKVYAPGAAKNIYITGIPVGSSIVFFKRLVKQ